MADIETKADAAALDVFGVWDQLARLDDELKAEGERLRLSPRGVSADAEGLLALVERRRQCLERLELRLDDFRQLYRLLKQAEG